MESPEVTGLLKAWSSGDQAALDRLASVVYEELRRMARRYMKNERSGNTLQTTALVNEVYLRLVDVKNVDWQHRAQFFAISAQMMRRILVDAARARGSRKRGGGAVKVNVDETAVLSPEPDASIVALDEALEEFWKVAPRQAKVGSDSQNVEVKDSCIQHCFTRVEEFAAQRSPAPGAALD